MPFIVLLGAGFVFGGWLLPRSAFVPQLVYFALRLLVGLCLAAEIGLFGGLYSLAWVQNGFALCTVVGIVLELRRRGQRPLVAYTEGYDFEAPYTRVEKFFAVLIGVFVLLSVPSAFLPETADVSASYVLGAAHVYARQGDLLPDLGTVFTAYPQFFPTLYALVLHNGGEASADALNMTFAAISVMLMLGLGREVSSRAAALCAAMFWVVSPAFVMHTRHISTVLGMAAIVLGVWLCLAYYEKEGRTEWLWLSGFLAGCACGARCAALIYFVLLLGYVFWRTRDQGLFPGVSFLAVGGLTALPWFLYGLLVIGNPFFPHASAWLTSPFMPLPEYSVLISPTQNTAAELPQRAMTVIRALWDMFMRPQRVDGFWENPGPFVLIFGPAAVLMTRSLARWSLATGLFMALAHAAAWPRMVSLLPFLAPTYGAASHAAMHFPKAGRLVRFCAYALSALQAVLSLHAMSEPLSARWRHTSPELYKAEHVPGYAMWAYINRELNDGSTVLTLDPRVYYADPRIWCNLDVLEVLGRLPVEVQRAWLELENVRYVVLPAALLEDLRRKAPNAYAMLEQWRKDRARFRLLEDMHLARTERWRGERVWILERREAVKEPLESAQHAEP